MNFEKFIPTKETVKLTFLSAVGLVFGPNLFAQDTEVIDIKAESPQEYNIPATPTDSIPDAKTFKIGANYDNPAIANAKTFELGANPDNESIMNAQVFKPGSQMEEKLLANLEENTASSQLNAKSKKKMFESKDGKISGKISKNNQEIVFHGKNMNFKAKVGTGKVVDTLGENVGGKILDKFIK